jgi:type I restriction enzyme, S subunit
MELTAEKYKQTEIGLLPNDWVICTVAQIGTINGRVGWKGYTKKDLRDNGPFAIGAKHIDKENRLDLSDPTCISVEKFIESPEIMVFKGDILIVQRGTIGKVMVIDKDIGDATINPSMLILRLKNVPPKYAFYYLISYSGQNQILSDTSSTGVPMITQKQVLNFQIPLPPSKTEQTAIARVLSDTDNLIQTLEKLIAIKRLIKQGAMQELMKPKKDWETKRLGEVAILKARIGWQGLTTAEYKTKGDYFLITGTEFKNGFIDWASCFYVDEKRYRQDKYIQVKEHDVLVTKDGTIGKVALVNSVPKPATLNSGVFVIRPVNNSFYPDFFYYTLLSDIFLKFLSQLSAGSTINHLYQKDFITFKFQTPKTIKEQKEIAHILADMDSEIEVLEKKLNKYKMLKQGMMQVLLTGKIRLS